MPCMNEPAIVHQDHHQHCPSVRSHRSLSSPAPGMALLPHALIIASSLLIASASNTTVDGDLSALLAFKAKLSDPQGTLRSNWTAGTPHCSWLGVTCSRLHRLRVTALVLPGVPLAGSMAAELGTLSFLSVLNLSSAELSGPIPDDLGHLSRLLSLDLSSNRLSGTVPSAFCNLTKLEILDLESNNLTGEIPPELHNLQNIAYLILSRNGLSGQIPQGLFNGTNQLIVLNLAFNSLTGSIPSAIGFLPNIQTLALSVNQLSGPIPPSLFNMSSLQRMYLTKNNLSGHIPKNESFSLPMLQYVNLYKNQLAGTVPPGFGACKRLQTLILAYNHFAGVIPSWLAAMPRLVAISLGNNGLSGEIPAGLGNLTSLTVLDFTVSELQGKIPPELGRLTQLQWLNLERNSLSGTIPASMKNLSMLSVLDVSFNSLTGPVPRSAFGEALTELYIESNKLSGDVSFIADVSGCRGLKYLVMDTNYFTGSIPGSIANLSSLEIFRAFENQITGSIPDMATNQSNLLFIDLRNNRFTGKIPALITEMQSLQGIELSSNDLSGTIPADIGKLENLIALNLAINNLHGPIPDSIGNLSKLQRLELSSNQLTSTIPTVLWGLQNIVDLDMSHNALNGSLPQEVGNLKEITLLDLSSNQFLGNIPVSLGALSTLTTLNLSKNMLQDLVPDTIGKLSSIKTLDLSHNSLSGTIPKSFANLSYLTSLNLSFNRLGGQVPTGGVFSSISLQSLAGNTALCGLPRLGFPRCPNNEFSLHRSRNSRLVKLLLPSILAAGVVASCLLVIIKIRSHKKPNELPLPVITSLGENNYRPVSYYELVRATDGFSDDNLLGAGSFGRVFRGKLDDEQIVAVKVLDMQLERAGRSFDDECRALRMARHRNLVRILTTCSSLDFKALVLQYMPNGSLDEWLFSSGASTGARRARLGLVQRVKAMLDVASAMAYLHHEHFEVVLHCDLKTSNVLLDADMTACVADFGVARLLLGDDTSIFSRSMPGTIGYMAPEYGSTGKASRKSDMFSYGIMLLEVFTGKKPTDGMFAGELSLREWVNGARASGFAGVVDPDIFVDDEAASGGGELLDAADWRSRGGSSSNRSCLAQVLNLGLQCTQELPEERMAMKDVAAKLVRINEGFSSR